jgi:Dolichyl-phosphate-mannose-protein mannosyltransferase
LADNVLSGRGRVWSSRWPVIGILVLHGALLAYSASVHSPTFNELGHIPAGICHWHHQRFELYNVNPPLPRMVAALPLLVASPETDWSNYGMHPLSREVVPMGIRFAKANGLQTVWLFTLGRWACILFSLLGAWICNRWASDLWGRPSGLIAATLWCFSPWVLGHGSLVMPDVPAAAMAVTACHAFWHWTKRPDWHNCLVTGILLGLAELCKTTLLLLYVVLPFFWLIRWLGTRDRRGFAGQATMLLLMLTVSLGVLNSGYGYVGSFQRLSTFTFKSELLSDIPYADNAEGGNRFADELVGRLLVPVPRDYLQGIDRQRADFESGYRSYFRGEWRNSGWWYYYLYGLAIKVPLGTWLLFGLAISVTLFSGQYSTSLIDDAFPLLVSGAIVAMVSSQTGFNMHVRYVIPALPFLFIWISKVGRAFVLRNTCIAATTSVFLGASILSSLWCYPHSLSYFQELVGGPRRGHRHLLDSNIAWGQDLLYLRDRVNRHATAPTLHLAAFGCFDPRWASIEFCLPPVGPRYRNEPWLPRERCQVVRPLGPQPGTHAIDVNFLHSTHYRTPTGDGRWANVPTDCWNYAYFQRFQPVATAGYSVYIYHITLEEANRVRRDLGLPELGEDWDRQQELFPP